MPIVTNKQERARSRWDNHTRIRKRTHRWTVVFFSLHPLLHRYFSCAVCTDGPFGSNADDQSQVLQPSPPASSWCCQVVGVIRFLSSCCCQVAVAAKLPSCQVAVAAEFLLLLSSCCCCCRVFVVVKLLLLPSFCFFCRVVVVVVAELWLPSCWLLMTVVRFRASLFFFMDFGGRRFFFAKRRRSQKKQKDAGNAWITAPVW